jgi:hypothetical protein
MSQKIGAASPKYGPTISDIPNGNTLKRPGKELRMMALFAAGFSFNRFQAEKHGDHCLPTTISDLQKTYGIKFQRQQEIVPTRFGRPARVFRYWLEDDSLLKARKLLGLEEVGI